jgi:hypothetical protein
MILPLTRMPTTGFALEASFSILTAGFTAEASLLMLRKQKCGVLRPHWPAWRGCEEKKVHNLARKY